MWCFYTNYANMKHTHLLPDSASMRLSCWLRPKRWCWVSGITGYTGKTGCSFNSNHSIIHSVGVNKRMLSCGKKLVGLNQGWCQICSKPCGSTSRTKYKVRQKGKQIFISVVVSVNSPYGAENGLVCWKCCLPVFIHTQDSASICACLHIQQQQEKHGFY